MKQDTILMIEDDPDVMKINRMVFARSGYSVLEAKTLSEGLFLLRGNKVSLLLLDISLPDGSGVDFCREVRKSTDVPILFLTAKGTTPDVLDGFSAGGDDYLSKPYDLNILLARVQALLRRTVKAVLHDDGYALAGLRMDFTARRAYVNGRDALLKTKEFAVLETLVKNRDRFMGAQELYNVVWSMDAADGLTTVRTHIYHIRRKLAANGGSGITIAQKRGKGYRLLAGAQEESE